MPNHTPPPRAHMAANPAPCQPARDHGDVAITLELPDGVDLTRLRAIYEMAETTTALADHADGAR